jgi:hypothetical protein
VGRRLGQNVDERRGGIIWEQFLIDTHCGMWGLEGHHSSPGRETEGESAYAYRLCCARARCGVGLAAAAPPRAREHERDLSKHRCLFLCPLSSVLRPAASCEVMSCDITCHILLALLHVTCCVLRATGVLITDN